MVLESENGVLMALKAEVDTLEGLPEPIIKEYKEVDRAGKKVYILDIDGEDLPDEIPAKQALKKARDNEKKNRQDAEKKAKALEELRDQLQEQMNEMRRGNIPKGDVDALEKSWKEKVDNLNNKYTSDIAARDRTLQNLLVESVADRLANDLSAAPHLMKPHIKGRLSTELVDGQFVTRVLDKEGKPSALSIEELQKEISQDKQFSLILKGSKASGSGASGGGKPSNGSGAPTQFDPTKKFDYNKATPREIAEYQKQKRAYEAEHHTGG